jgi:hypothetical protein
MILVTIFSFHHHKIATEVSDRGPEHGNRRIVSLVSNRRLFTVLQCFWKDIVATPVFILTHFVANRLRSTRLWLLNSTQSPVFFLRVTVLD